MRGIALVGLVVLAVAASAPTAAPAPPTAVAPRQRVDLAFPATPGRRIDVATADELRRALAHARGGDGIALKAGGVFTGPFTVPATPGDGWIVVRASEDAGVPPAGTRLDPRAAPALPKLVAPPGEPALRTAPGAHHVRFVGIEMKPAEGVYTHGLVELGTARETDPSALPHDLVLDRCWVHGDPAVGGRRGIVLNGRGIGVVDSYVSDWKGRGEDTQAIAGWNGPGPFALVNDYLEAAGENVLFGGGDPAITGLVPADIELRGNELRKPLGWRGARWSVKNLLELKSAERVLVEGNAFENNWVDAQNGFAILFTVRNQEGRAPWSVVRDVTFTANVVRDVAAAINVLGTDDLHPSRRAERIVIRDNLFVGVGDGAARGTGTFLQMIAGPADVVVDHNTVLQSGSIVVADGAPTRGFVYTNNIARHNAYGVTGSGAGVGADALRRYFPGAVFSHNVLVGAPSDRYPRHNFFPRSVQAVGFRDTAAGDYRLAPRSPYRNAATDGTDVGAHVVPPAVRARHAAAAAGARPASAAARRPFVARAGAAVFSGSLLLLVYVYLGYPALVRVAAALVPRPARRAAHAPSVSVVVIAHDEVRRIDGRVLNLLAVDYPHDRLEIVVASDGSTDATVEHARAWERDGVRVLAFPEHRGKAAVINDAVRSARGEILVLADARQRFAPDAVRALVAPFADPAVGAVSGELVLEEGTSAVAGGVGAYWRYEKAIRQSESALDSTVGATGAIYAVRAGLVEPIPPDTILDDVLIPMRIARRGYRVLFEPAARAYDRAPAHAAQEFTRKVRTLAGNFQLFARERWLLDPRRNRLWVQTVSHKLLRLAGPALLAAALVGNAALLDALAGRLALAAQLAFYGAALVGARARAAGRRLPLVGIPYVFCLLNWATVVAFVHALTGRQPVTWARGLVDDEERGARARMAA